MIGLAICVLAFVATFWAGRHSLGRGIVSLLVFGYFYGLLRANFLTTFSYFIFDMAVIGLYLSQFVFSSGKKVQHSAALELWVVILIVWPLIMIFVPFQPFLISLVGFRGITFFIPILVLGSRLRDRDLLEVSRGLVVLNLIAGVFALAEYLLGVPRFFPPSPVTTIIYASSDVAGGFFRIPATFINAHAYGATMVYSMALTLGLWSRLQSRIFTYLAVLSVGVALLGVLLSAARLNFLMAVVAISVTMFTTRLGAKFRFAFVIALLVVAGLAATQERLQRFTSLKDTDYVSERIAGSVNRTFWEILTERPMGNGLGSGGTSIPYFLEGQVRNPMTLENEYALILGEQGIIGLLFWLGFIAWFYTRAPVAFAKGGWANSRRIGWGLCAFSLGTAWIGTGLFSSIPGTVLMFLLMGWTSTARVAERPAGVSGPAQFQRYWPARVVSTR